MTQKKYGFRGISVIRLLGLVMFLYNCSQLCGTLYSELHIENIFRGKLYHNYIIPEVAIL